MSYYSNHEPETIEACHFGEDPRECPPCNCPADGHGTGDMCSGCQGDYEQWSASLDAEWDGIIDILPEPCGQQFADGPLPDNMPF